jgi:hypothetical protein
MGFDWFCPLLVMVELVKAYQSVVHHHLAKKICFFFFLPKFEKFHKYLFYIRFEGKYLITFFQSL